MALGMKHGFYSASGAAGVYYGSRGVFAGGYLDWSNKTNVIDYITIPTPANATDFGDTNVTDMGSAAACSNGTRGIFGGFPGIQIDYITIATAPSNATDFGDLTRSHWTISACSDGTKGVWGGSNEDDPVGNDIDYVMIATPGNATDFGDLSVTRTSTGACSDGTKGVWAGGHDGSSWSNVIDYIIIATISNASDFGNLTVARRYAAACSDGTKGVWGSGLGSNGSGGTINYNTLDYITIANTSTNATDFGNLTTTGKYLTACSDGTKGVWAGGTRSAPGVTSDIIDYITIANTSTNATDFGDLTVNRWGAAACSGD